MRYWSGLPIVRRAMAERSAGVTPVRGGTPMLRLVAGEGVRQELVVALRGAWRKIGAPGRNRTSAHGLGNRWHWSSPLTFIWSFLAPAARHHSPRTQTERLPAWRPCTR